MLSFIHIHVKNFPTMYQKTKPILAQVMNIEIFKWKINDIKC